MFAIRFKFGSLAMGFVLLLIGGASSFWLAQSPCVATGEPARPAKAVPSDEKKSKLKDLLKERLAVLHKLSAQTTADYRIGRVPFDRVQQAMRAVLDAELELCEAEKERVTVLEKIVTLAKANEKSAEQRYKAGSVPSSDVLMARAARLEAEIALERGKTKPSGRPK